MSDNIVHFPKPESEIQIWVCRCGCQSWRIREDNSIECCNCNNISEDAPADWRKRMPPVDPNTELTNAGVMNVNAMGDVDFARNAVFRTIGDWHKTGELAVLVGYNKEGHGKHWLAIETQEQKDWIIGLLEDVLKFTKATKVDDA